MGLRGSQPGSGSCLAPLLPRRRSLVFSRRENAKRFLREKTTSGRSYTAPPLLASFALARYWAGSSGAGGYAWRRYPRVAFRSHTPGDLYEGCAAVPRSVCLSVCRRPSLSRPPPGARGAAVSALGGSSAACSRAVVLAAAVARRRVSLRPRGGARCPGGGFLGRPWPRCGPGHCSRPGLSPRWRGPGCGGFVFPSRPP